MTQAQKTRTATTRTTEQATVEATKRDAETQALLDKADDLMADIEDVVEETRDQIVEVIDTEVKDAWEELFRRMERGSPCGCGGFFVLTNLAD